jgi:hypothetical protein
VLPPAETRIVQRPVAVPHDVERVYVTVSIPALRPVTTPAELIDRIAPLPPQVPPPIVDDNVIVLPTHTAVGPESVPAEPGYTVTTAIVVAMPQLEATV